MMNSALCLIGDGLGNLIEQSCLPQAAATMYRSVDVWCPRSTPEHASVLQGLDGIRNLWVGPHQFQRLREASAEISYDAIFPTFLIPPRFYRKIPCKEQFASLNPKRHHKHESELVMAGIRRAGFQAGCPGPTPPPFCGFDGWKGPALHQGREGPIIGISTGGNSRPIWRFKRYKQYAAVVDGLLRRFPAAKFALLGVASDDPIDHDAVQDWRGMGTLREVCGLIRNECDVFLGNDCGLCHAAAALGTPTFMVFGPTVMWKNTPRRHALGMQVVNLLCAPCQYSKQGIGRRQDNTRCENECLTGMDPRVVIQNVIGFLERRGS